MKISVKEPKSVMDLYEWLPGYGENAVSTQYNGSTLIVSIRYDQNAPESEENIQYVRELSFFNTCFFCVSNFPGPGDLNQILSETKWQIGSLIEFKHSDLADAWNTYHSKSVQRKHYLIQFTSENLQVEAIAGAFDLCKERIY